MITVMEFNYKHNFLQITLSFFISRFTHFYIYLQFLDVVTTYQIIFFQFFKLLLNT